MQTFSIHTLGCRVNQYESEQIATLLVRRGLVRVGSHEKADLRIINTCSVTQEAANKSRQSVRRAIRLPVLPSQGLYPAAAGVTSPPEISPAGTKTEPAARTELPRVVVTGCWATSDREEASRLPGVDAVLGHHDDVGSELDRLLQRWSVETSRFAHAPPSNSTTVTTTVEPSPRPLGDEESMIKAGASAPLLTPHHKSLIRLNVKGNSTIVGTRGLPLLEQRQPSHQRALMKIQDGCDAHCTYCIIPQLRPALWNKPVGDAVTEAQRLVDAGHVEIILTGIFLGAYGQPTAIRRRQSRDTASPLAELVEALCSRVMGLARLRLSSLEPGDLTPALISVLRSWPQCVPHFHLPLQSGSDQLLRRMNRQYLVDDFVKMVENVRAAFDRPALTTDIIVGFPGEDDEGFRQTLDVVDRVGFVHIHAFPYSPRPGTAAARWPGQRVPDTIISHRIDVLNERSRRGSLEYRRQFVGECVEVLVERQQQEAGSFQHGRCERYFDVCFEATGIETGERVRLRIDRVTPHRTWGTLGERVAG
jgi:threonylcarbamoyladenosine tRNA methylthiotransferase MtaB